MQRPTFSLLTIIVLQLFFLRLFFLQGRVMSWWLMDRLARALLTLLVFLLLDWEMKLFWLVVGFPTLYIRVWTDFVDYTREEL